jgi:hypothetical protein
MRLEAWINEKHLDPVERARTAERYAADPFGSIWFDDFLQPAMLTALRRVYAEEGRFKRTFAVFDPSLATGRREVTAEEYFAAPVDGRFDSGLIMEGPRAEGLEPGIATFVAFHWLLGSPVFHAFLGDVVGYELGGMVGSHARIIGAGETLGRHSDATQARALCMVMYFSPDWVPADRGVLRQFAPDGQEREIEPQPNRVVLFSVAKGYAHAVEAQASDRAPRWSHTSWYSRASKSLQRRR